MNETYRSLVESTSDFFYLVDARGRYLFANGCYLRQQKHELDEIIGKNYADLHAAEETRVFQEQLRQVIASGESHQKEHFSAATGQVFLRTYSPARDPAYPDRINAITIVSKDITKMKTLEQELREKENRYHTLFETANDAILVGDFHRIIDCNKKSLDLFRCTKDRLMGTAPEELSPLLQPDGALSREKSLVLLHNAMDGEPQSFEWRFRRLDGESFDSEVSMSAMELGGRRYVQTLIRDVSELKQAEALYRIIAESSYAGVYMVQEGKFIYLNTNAARYVGYTPEEMIGGAAIDIIHPADRESARRCAVDMLKGVRTAPYEFRVVDKEGGIRWIMETLRAVEYRGRRAILANSMDVTELKAMEASLRLSEERYRTIVENMTDGYYEVDLTGKFLFINDAFATTAGYRKEEVLGRVFQDFVDEEQAANGRRVFGRVFATGEPVKGFEWQIRDRQGEKMTLEVSIILIRDDENRPRGFRGIARDITERRRAEKQIRYYAFHDFLTGLPNRNLLYDRVEIALANAARKNRGLAVMLLDLDKFKNLNDTMGHEAGDHILKGAAKRLQHLVRKGDTVARIGGDEFIVILTDVRYPGDAVNIAEKVIAAFKEPFFIDGREVRLTVSAGVSLYPWDGMDFDCLKRCADDAMYKAKDKGRNCYVLTEAARLLYY